MGKKLFKIHFMLIDRIKLYEISVTYESIIDWLTNEYHQMEKLYNTKWTVNCYTLDLCLSNPMKMVN